MIMIAPAICVRDDRGGDDVPARIQFRSFLVLAVVAATLVSLRSGAAASPAACPDPHPGVIRTAPGAGKRVALTFDDGPGPFTVPILAILRANNVRATFFDTGANDARYPALTRATAAEGHLVGDHTWDHAGPADVPGGWTKEYLSDQFARTNAQQERLIGRPTCFFRPPYGASSPDMLPTARAFGMSTVLWSVDSQDWAQPPGISREAQDAIVRNALAGLAQEHPIVLLHAARGNAAEDQVAPDRGNTALALPRIIDAYRDAGYTFVDLAGGSGLPRR
jgi:peptidoglycan/xylan/chitin deacetylase (PgdA/CDA1 family)